MPIFSKEVVQMACSILDNIVDASTTIPDPSTNCLWSIIEDLLLIAQKTKNPNYPTLLRTPQAQGGRKRLMKTAGITLEHLEQIKNLAQLGQDLSKLRIDYHRRITFPTRSY